MKKIAVSVSAALLALLMLLSLGACKPREVGSDEPVRALLARFEDACHQLDVNEILDCVNPDVSKPLKFAADLVGGFTDADSEQLFDMLTSLLQNAGDIGDNKQFFSSVHMTVNSVDMESDKAKAHVTVSYTEDGAERTKDATVICILRDGQWYVAEFRF